MLGGRTLLRDWRCHRCHRRRRRHENPHRNRNRHRPNGRRSQQGDSKPKTPNGPVRAYPSAAPSSACPAHCPAPMATRILPSRKTRRTRSDSAAAARRDAASVHGSERKMPMPMLKFPPFPPPRPWRPIETASTTRNGPPPPRERIRTAQPGTPDPPAAGDGSESSLPRPRPFANRRRADRICPPCVGRRRRAGRACAGVLIWNRRPSAVPPRPRRIRNSGFFDGGWRQNHKKWW
jgi:hypothetical protein